jgi:uncharacterized protein
MRFLLQLLLGVAVIWLLRKWLLSAARARRPDAQPKAVRPDTPVQVKGLVACSYCGVHLPEAESSRLGEWVFCSLAHRDAFVSARTSVPGSGPAPEVGVDDTERERRRDQERT